MSTLILQVPDDNLISKVKQACKMFLGVRSVKIQRPAKAKEDNITKTVVYREARRDVKHGHVYHADSVDDILANTWRAHIQRAQQQPCIASTTPIISRMT